jgi:hypothetical protein
MTFPMQLVIRPAGHGVNNVFVENRPPFIEETAMSARSKEAMSGKSFPRQ